MIIDKNNIDIEHFFNADVVTKGKTPKSNRRKYFKEVFSIATMPGEILEFGVFQGRSIKEISLNFPTTCVYGFDSFEGLPEDWFLTTEEKVLQNCLHPKGHFSTNSLINDIPKNVTLIKGFFDQSLPNWLLTNKLSKIKLLHIDSDLYSSAATIFENLNKFIVPGTVIMFDELCPWTDESLYSLWREGEWKALNEWVCNYDRSFKIICRNNYYQAAIQIIE